MNHLICLIFGHVVVDAECVCCHRHFPTDIERHVIDGQPFRLTVGRQLLRLTDTQIGAIIRSEFDARERVEDDRGRRAHLELGHSPQMRFGLNDETPEPVVFEVDENAFKLGV